jgi:hypothetical protein
MAVSYPTGRIHKPTQNYVYNASTLQWEPMTQPGGGSTTVGTVDQGAAGASPWPVSDGGGSLSIDDGGGSITVDGAVIVTGTLGTTPILGQNPSGNINAVGQSVSANSGGDFNTFAADVCNFYVTGPFVGTLKAYRVSNVGTFNEVTQLYNLTDNTIDSVIALNKLYAFPTAGTADVYIKCTAYTSGTAAVDLQTGAGTIPPPTTAVTATSWPLPTGAATGTKQDTGNTSLASIDGHLDVALSTRLKPADTLTKVATVDTITNPVAITAAALPLPSGAATGAKQDTGNTSLASIDTKLTNPLPVSATSLPLPTGAATSGNQVTELASLASIDTKLTAPLSVTGPLTDTQLRATAVPVSGTVAITLPSTLSVDPTGNLSNDSYNAYRLQEKQLMVESATQIYAMLNDERASSQQMGYEVR